MRHIVNSFKPKLQLSKPHSLSCFHTSNYIRSNDYLKADTGASSTFLILDHAKYLQDTNSITYGPKVHLPKQAILRPTIQGKLPLTNSLEHLAIILHMSYQE